MLLRSFDRPVRSTEKPEDPRTGGVRRWTIGTPALIIWTTELFLPEEIKCISTPHKPASATSALVTVSIIHASNNLFVLVAETIA